MPVPRDQLGNYYYQLIEAGPRGLHAISDYKNDGTLFVDAWNGQLTGPADLPAGLTLRLSGKTPTDLVNCPGSLLIVSPRLAEVFARVAGPDAITAIPIRENLNPPADYLLINLNRSLSIKSHYPKGRKVDYVIETKLNYSKVPPDLHLFRIDEVPGAVYISGTMALALSDAKPVGVAFLTVHNIAPKPATKKTTSRPRTTKEPTYPVPSTDAAMKKAMARARRTFPEFIRELQADADRVIPLLEAAMVKAYFADAKTPDRGEHMWVDEIEWDGKLISGRLQSKPNKVRSVRHGSTVQFPLERLSDWLYVVDEKAHGAFTVQLLRSRMSIAERREHDSHYPFKFG